MRKAKCNALLNPTVPGRVPVGKPQRVQGIAVGDRLRPPTASGAGASACFRTASTGRLTCQATRPTLVTFPAQAPTLQPRTAPGRAARVVAGPAAEHAATARTAQTAAAAAMPRPRGCASCRMVSTDDGAVPHRLSLPVPGYYLKLTRRPAAAVTGTLSTSGRGRAQPAGAGSRPARPWPPPGFREGPVSFSMAIDTWRTNHADRGLPRHQVLSWSCFAQPL